VKEWPGGRVARCVGSEAAWRLAIVGAGRIAPIDSDVREDIIYAAGNRCLRPFVLRLSKALKSAGWRVKIYDFERLEPPHVTIYHKGRTWRLSLRDGRFLDMGDTWSQIAEDVQVAIESQWERLRAEWDALHPENPVASQENE
jgi:hypothetical protein